MNNPPFVIKQLGLQPYLQVYQAMHDFTRQRDNTTPDEIWLVQHPPVFTQGRVGKAEHLLKVSDIPVIQTDRGGQITYHGPGQQIMYVLLDLKRLGIGIRQTVTALEQCVISTLTGLKIASYAKSDAPGVYVNEQKICSLGLHIQQGRTLHGLALNVNMDLTPFTMINPCGYAGLQMTQVTDLTADYDADKISQDLVHHFSQILAQQQNDQ